MAASVWFDVPHLYYLPQYQPVAAELARRGVECRFAFHDKPEVRELARGVMERERLPGELVPPASLPALFARERPDWVIFGNGSPFAASLPRGTRTALLYHGIGVKSCYYDPELAEMDVRFVEGEYRLRELRRRCPGANLVLTGFAKLDPLFAPGGANKPQPPEPTILYAPTFYPSSIERMPADWPSLFPRHRVVIKPHHFSLTGKGYAGQRRLLARWSRAPNVTVAGPLDHSLVPFMAEAGILLSEASSAFFEFAALDRPLVWLDFLKLRLSYRGPFRYRLLRRMDQEILRYADIAAHCPAPRDLPAVVEAELADPARLSPIRRRYTEELIGPTDGRASERVADYLLGEKPVEG